MTTTIYGIANCDTVKKARVWLDDHGVSYRFHDYKKVGVDAEVLDRAIAALGWEKVLNRQGTTFRKLSEEERADLNAARARAIMIAHPSTIKRPLLVRGPLIEAGYSADRYAALFADG